MMVSPLGQPDRLVWRGAADGAFSVKTAYHLAVSRQAKERGECSRETAKNNIWKTIWKLKIPPAARHFCWKVCNNLLPTNSNLAAKKVVSSSECPICCREPETVVHCLWSCPSVVAVWQKSSRRLQKMALVARDGREWLSCLVGKLEEPEQYVEAIMVLRSIWMRRNVLVFDNKFSSPFPVVALTREAVKE